MKLIHSDYEILEQGVGMDGINEQIELAGRTCYKSEPKYRWYSEDKKRWINEDSEEWKAIENPKKEYPTRGENISAKPFVDRMIKSGHGAMLESGTVYLKTPPSITHYNNNKYSIVTTECSDLDGINRYITTNLRVLVENGWLEDLKYLCEPTEYHEKRITVKFTCDRGVSHEFVRHRVFSFAQESTRYCNYSKDKFGNELTFIVNDELHDDENATGCDYHNLLENIELTYLQIIKDGYTAQQARTILPNALKTELVMTGFASDWKGFFKLRDNSKAHPDAQALAKPLHEEFIKKGYIDGNLD